jgi:ribonuclease HII
MDEVGRGALAGPVTVGVVVITGATGDPPPGVADSKALTPAEREALVEPIEAWCAGYAVGHAGAAEIDRHGIVAALRLAGRRALAALPAQPGAIVLDGRHNWLAAPPSDLFDQPEPDPWAIQMQVKADASCTTVAAASVLAKVTRDALMVRLHRDHPAYGWDHNKGYGAADHLAALRRLGPTPLHRRTWRLPEPAQPGGEVAAVPRADDPGQARVA